MPEITEAELAELQALRAAQPAIPGIKIESPAPEAAPKRAVPPRAKRPSDRQSKKVGTAPAPSGGGYSLGKRRNEETTDLSLPSGALCQVRIIGPESLMSSGILDQIDTLTGIVSNDLITPAEGKAPQIDAAALAQDFGAITKVLKTYDELVLKVVVQPTLLPAPEDGVYDDEAAYIDQVSLEDKAFIVQFVLGGTRDLEAFRAESEGALAGLDPVAG